MSADEKMMEDSQMLSDSNSDEEDDDMMEEVIDDENQQERIEASTATDSNKTPPETYLPHRPLEQGEYLNCDTSAYRLLRSFEMPSPCLSFDVITDNLGDDREDVYPLTMTLVAGTQAPSVHLNNIIVMRMSNLHKMENENDDDDDDSELSDDEDEDVGGLRKEPQLAAAFIKHKGCINRIRTTRMDDRRVLAASWSELGRVNIWDLSRQLEVVEDADKLKEYVRNKESAGRPIFTFAGHQKEGFAVDWNPTNKGTLATGDCNKNIHIWHMTEASSWNVDHHPLVGHTQSVEDIQWSPVEPTVLASCSVDRSIRIWDVRAPPTKANMLTNASAHASDVNVIHWNRLEPFIVSGGDDGFLHVWDLRLFKENRAVATFKHHTEHVTTVEWHPTDAGVFASGGADNQIAQWDLSVEKDSDVGIVAEEELEGIPPQLLFIHQGQTDVKELHWHPQMPGVLISTAQDFNIFRTISV